MAISLGIYPIFRQTHMFETFWNPHCVTCVRGFYRSRTATKIGSVGSSCLASCDYTDTLGHVQSDPSKRFWGQQINWFTVRRWIITSLSLHLHLHLHLHTHTCIYIYSSYMTWPILPPVGFQEPKKPSAAMALLQCTRPFCTCSISAMTKTKNA